MASITTTCIICHKPCRLIGTGGATVTDLENGPQVHQPGTEGDEGCLAKWQDLDAAAQLADAEAQLDSARARVSSLGTEAHSEPKSRAKD